jgi:hypothetical protein
LLKKNMEISMKLIKVLTPVILSGFLAFPAFAAEEQNAAAQAQIQAQDQQANAGRSEQLATESTSANSAQQSNDSKVNGKQKGEKCTKCRHKKVHGAKSKGSESNVSGSTTSENQPSQAGQEQSQASNQNQ